MTFSIALEALPNIGHINEGDLIFLDEIQEVPQAISALAIFLRRPKGFSGNCGRLAF